MGLTSDGRYGWGFVRGIAGRAHRETAAVLSAGKRAATAVMACLGGISTNGQEAMGATETGGSVEYVFTNGGAITEILACIGYIIIPLILSMGLARFIIVRRKRWFRQDLTKSDIYVLSFICGIQIYMIMSAICVSLIEEKMNISNLIINFFIFLSVLGGIYLPYWVICAPCHLPYLVRARRGTNQRGRTDVIYITGILTVVLTYLCIFWFYNSGVE